MSTFAIIGLGKMGAGLAQQALEKKHHVVGYTLGGVPAELTAAGVRAIKELRELSEALPRPRLVFLSIPAGAAVDDTIDQLRSHLSPGDIIADCGNSYWGDSIRRHRKLHASGIFLLDVGTSGGPEGARHGACFMVGGDKTAVDCIEPLLRSLAVEGGFIHAGPAGTGHFVKLVHNGIEFGMLQAIGEGVALLEKFAPPVPVAQVLECWRHGSVIRSWLIDLMTEMYNAQHGLESTSSYVEDTGEVNWLVDDALHLEVPVPVIAQAVMELVASRDSARNYARAIAMMRHGFGGHPYGSDSGIARERHEGRVGGFIKPDGL
jgi:6-phosphogluconate dehydrogenase